MGIFKSSLKFINEVVTLGGASRLEEAKRAYQEKHAQYLVLYEEATGYRKEIEENTKAIGDALTKSKACLDQSEKIIKRSVNDACGPSIEFGVQTLHKVDNFNSEFNMAINFGVGSIAGGSLAVGSWALVATLGSASTGATISGLSGIAATNATLAWFGGGALAAGGAGMAGGLAVIGGIVAIPMVYFAARGSHKKAKEAEEARGKVEVAIAEIGPQIEALRSVLATVKLRKSEICEICRSLIADTLRFTKVIRPYGILSVTKQKLLSLFGKSPYTLEQSEALKELSLTITRFLGAFRTNKEPEQRTSAGNGS